MAAALARDDEYHDLLQELEVLEQHNFGADLGLPTPPPTPGPLYTPKLLEATIDNVQDSTSQQQDTHDPGIITPVVAQGSPLPLRLPDLRQSVVSLKPGVKRGRSSSCSLDGDVQIRKIEEEREFRLRKSLGRLYRRRYSAPVQATYLQETQDVRLTEVLDIKKVELGVDRT